jgi:hypothetical protein
MGMKNFENLSQASRFWGMIFLLSAVIFSPFYVYASGLPQPAHVVMLIASIALIFLNREACINLVRSNMPGVLFLLLIFVINAIYTFYYLDKIFIIATIYWVYGYIVLLAVLCIARDKWLAIWIGRLIILALLMILVSYLFGWGDLFYWPRYAYFFNGPNQLAHFVICLLLVYMAVTKGRLDLGLYIVYTLSIFAIITTGGRSAYLGVAPLVLLLLWVARLRLLHVVLLLLIPFAVSFSFKPLCLPSYIPTPEGNKRIGCLVIEDPSDTRFVSSNTISRLSELTAREGVKNQTSIWVQLFARGYMRVVQYPQYLLYGAGQGKDERFDGLNGDHYEIHSSPVAVLFYYGILGFLLFTAFLWNLFSKKINLLFLSPLLVYGLFTYGLRSPYFWLALGFLAVMPDLLSKSRERASD